MLIQYKTEPSTYQSNSHVLYQIISHMLSSSYAEVWLWLFFLVFRPQCVW